MHDCARVADEAACQRGVDRRRQQLRGLELLYDGERLSFRASARLVVSREGQEDDEAGKDREGAREHAEHPGRAVAVLEVAAVWRPAPDEQHRRDRCAVGDEKDDDAPEKAHT
jgi:hypothetical protein